MQNPDKQIRNLLESLGQRAIDLNAKFRDAPQFYDIIKEERYLEVVNNTPTFFRIHNNSILRDLIIVFAKTFDPKSRRSIQKLIQWISDNLDHINFKGNQLTEKDINTFFEKINSVEEVLIKIKTQRDKFIAHDDPIYFDEPYRINEDAPINLEELEKVLDVLREIIFAIYLAIENSHYSWEIVGYMKINFIVKLLRHQQILSNDESIRKRMMDGDLPFATDT